MTRTADEILQSVKDCEEEIAALETQRGALPEDAFAQRLTYKERIESLQLDLAYLRREARARLEGAAQTAR